MARKSKGRQKVEMKKMRNDSNLQVTFSKRRSGLFKKASELCTLCGAEVVIVVFSPGNKVYSFGHPNVEALIARYLSGNNPQPTGAMQLIEANRNFSVRELNMQITQIVSAFEIARKRGEELNKMRKDSQEQHWFDKPPEELTLAQAMQLQAALEELKKDVTMQHENNLILQSNPPQQQMLPAPPQQQQLYMGHPGASSSSAPAGGFLPYDPNRNMQVNNNVGFNPNMNPNMMPNMNVNQMNQMMQQMMQPNQMQPPQQMMQPNQMQMMQPNQMQLPQQANNPATGFNPNNPGAGFDNNPGFGPGFY